MDERCYRQKWGLHIFFGDFCKTKEPIHGLLSKHFYEACESNYTVQGKYQELQCFEQPNSGYITKSSIRWSQARARVGFLLWIPFLQLETFRRNLNQPLQMAAISSIITFWYIGEKNWMPHQKETLASLPFFSWKSENWFDVMSKAVKHIFKTRSLFTRTIFNHVFRVSSFSPFKYKAMRIAQTTEPMEFPERVQRHGFVV